MTNVWDFFQNEILGMKWLNRLIGSAIQRLGLDTQSRMGASIQFFLYDFIKIIVLLCVLIMIISYIQSYFPPERTRRILGRFEAEVHYITDMKIVMSYGIMSMPALVIDEQIASMGKVLKTAEIKKLLA